MHSILIFMASNFILFKNIFLFFFESFNSKKYELLSYFDKIEE